MTVRCRCGLELPTVNACDFEDHDCVTWTGSGLGPWVPSLAISPDVANLVECRAGEGLFGAFPEHVISPPRARVSRNYDQTIGASGDEVEFEYAVDDVNDGFWDISQPTRLTAPATGFYEFGGGFGLDTAVTGIDMSCEIRLNGVTQLAKRQLRLDSGTDNIPTIIIVATEYHLTAGEWIDFFFDHSHGSSKRLMASQEVSPVAYILQAALT